MTPRPPTSTLFPYTTLFRSDPSAEIPRHGLCVPPCRASARHVAVPVPAPDLDRKSTRLNSSHEWISYAVFCLKKKNLTAINLNTIHFRCNKLLGEVDDLLAV